MSINKRILIIDSEKDLREYMAKALRGAEYDVDTAENPQEALEKIRTAIEGYRPYIIVFLGIRLNSSRDGIDTAKQIHAMDKHVEIVLMSAYNDCSVREITAEIGSPDKLLYLKKPFHPDEIFQLCAYLCARRVSDSECLEYKGWLETLVRVMSRIKTSTGDKNIASTVLSAIMNFTSAGEGFIVKFNEQKKTWSIQETLNITMGKAEECVKKNQDRLSGDLSTHLTDGKYFLPMKRNGYFAVAIVYSDLAPSAPEWYKLLSLLLMTASEILSAESNS